MILPVIWTGSEERRWNLGEGDEISPHYRAVRRLGAGDIFEAYLARDADGGLAVAKMVRPHLIDDPAALRSLTREAELLGSLSHPSIVGLIATDLQGPQPHLVVEYLDAPALSDLVRDGGPLSGSVLRAVGAQIASALDHMHSCGVVHLDVKPGNVMCAQPARLIDLGIARRVGDGEPPRRAGTDPYMAPEMCLSEEVGPPADVFGWGATLWFAATGSPPWPPSDTRWPQTTEPVPDPPEEMPSALADLLSECLQRDPDRRPRSSELEAALLR